MLKEYFEPKQLQIIPCNVHREKGDGLRQGTPNNG